MSHKVKPQPQPEKRGAKDELKRNRSGGSVGKLQSGRKPSLEDKAGSIKPLKKGPPKAAINGKPVKDRQGSLARLERSSSATHGLNKAKSEKNLRPKSEHRRDKKKDAKEREPKEREHKEARRLGDNRDGRDGRDGKGVRASQPANRSLIKSVAQAKERPKESAGQGKKVGSQKPEPEPAAEERDPGLTYLRPEFDRLVLEALEITDAVYEKYFDMISNDNDTYYVLNAVPEIKEYRKDEEKRPVEPAVLTGKMSKISGLFEQLTVDKIVGAVKSRPIYFENKVKVVNMKLVLFTKFKVAVDIGFLQYAVDHDKLVVLRLYLSKIYRKMNYLAFVLGEALRQLGDKHAGVDKTCIFLHDRNLAIVKFFKFLGFKIERILTDSRSQKVDYFQEFVSRRKEFLAAYGKLPAA